MKIYISGPMTGIKDFNKPEFIKAESRLFGCGHDVFSPARLPQSKDITYAQYMDIDLAMIRACNAIHMLKGWESSKGAKFELDYAIMLGLQVNYENHKYVREEK